ncbi:hypothetical protein QBC45DRAFT_85385 [Copromyces sp. CBS 386.78]|nr:hypothetical protein QBC45DRAFT_85385 [Copromyces sp. CBS 386.78]
MSASSQSVHVGANRVARTYSFLLPHSDTRLSNHNSGRVSSQVTSLRLPHDLRTFSHPVLEAQRVGGWLTESPINSGFCRHILFFFFLSLLCVFLLLWPSCTLYPWTLKAGLYHLSPSWAIHVFVWVYYCTYRVVALQAFFFLLLGVLGFALLTREQWLWCHWKAWIGLENGTYKRRVNRLWIDMTLDGKSEPGE